MKVKSIPSSWIFRDGLRLDCNPYMAGALEARIRLEELAYPKQRLADLCKGGIGGLVNPGRITRQWVMGPAYGVPFLTSSSILQADLSNLRFIAKRAVRENPKLLIRQGYTLITRAGSIGRMSYTRPDMDGMACTEDVLRVIPDQERVPPGYLYAFLSSKFGVPLVTSGTYGAIIQHIEPEHIAGLPVPRLGEIIERQIDQFIQFAATLRTDAQALLSRATTLFLQSAGLEDQVPSLWHASGPELGFDSHIGLSHSLRASNYAPRVSRLLAKLRSGDYRTLGDICAKGHLGTGARFKRIDCDPEFGVCLIGQRQGFWMKPEGRWISTAHAPKGIFAKDETVMIASSGTLGEHEMYCRSIFITGRRLKHAYTQHFLRVVSGDSDVSGAYLFAFLRSELAFRCLRSMSTGSKQQEIHKDLISVFPVPILQRDIRTEIEALVREASGKRDKADVSEDNAISLIEKTIEEAP